MNDSRGLTSRERTRDAAIVPCKRQCTEKRLAEDDAKVQLYFRKLPDNPKKERFDYNQVELQEFFKGKVNGDTATDSIDPCLSTSVTKKSEDDIVSSIPMNAHMQQLGCNSQTKVHVDGMTESQRKPKPSSDQTDEIKAPCSCSAKATRNVYLANNHRTSNRYYPSSSHWRGKRVFNRSRKSVHHNRHNDWIDRYSTKEWRHNRTKLDQMRWQISRVKDREIRDVMRYREMYYCMTVRITVR